MKLPLYNQQGEVIGEIETPKIFDEIKVNMPLVHQVMRWQLLQNYPAYAHTKDRGEVRGGGRKPWRQKGTGRARHGSRRSPIWRGGGVTFGPRKETIRAIEINKKMRRKAILMALAAKLKDDYVRVLDNLQPPELKTKAMEKILTHFLKPRSKKKFETALVVLSENKPELVRIIRNLPYAEAIEARNFNLLALLNKKYLIIEPKSFEVIEKTFTLPKKIKKQELAMVGSTA
jgi:large subunit ribosomal protein L4